MPHLTPDLSTYDDLRHAAADERDHPEAAALEQLGQVLMTETLDVIGDTALEDQLTAIAEGLIGAFQSIALRLQRDWDRAADEVKRLSRDFDGSEVADVELQAATRRAHAAESAIRAVELIRDRASETYTLATGEVWTPWRGGTRRSGSTAAQIEAREALRAKRAKAHAAVDPGAFVVVFRGAPQADTATDASRVFDALNWALGEWPQMKLATTGLHGAERLAMKWARQKGVDLIAAKPDFDRFEAAAPFKANDQMLALEPVLALTLPSSLDPARAREARPFGPALNLGQKAEADGVRHLAISLRKGG
ncbi:DUF2493 domain-containing protein [Phenylobacterium sp. LjRoot219]|uniref:DUF2493 domain-containing protein n=1 Tax=Phenylobacterium sp. LjRoot219 TaxID=3342283 RepID=UPI003ED0E2E2